MTSTNGINAVVQNGNGRVHHGARTQISEHIVEIISDSGEGAQKCGQSFGSIVARTGIGVWTVEIIPAEIRPPARSVAGASGNRIRIGTKRMTNGGNETDLVVAFNEQVLLGRVRSKELKPGCTILLESMWRDNPDPNVARSYVDTYEHLVAAGYHVYEIPMEAECLKHVSDARKGKNMFALGMLCSIFGLDLQTGRDQIVMTFSKKSAQVIEKNIALLEDGYAWADANLDLRYEIPAVRSSEPQIVVNGNTALALGVLASGMEICAMYPITTMARSARSWPMPSKRSAVSSIKQKTRSPHAHSRSVHRMPVNAR
jgi:2-oxoglutarate ferredoxin oxidoreductase subunit alpha